MPEKRDRPTVVGLGEILWDMLPAGKQLGGAPANFAYHAQALGARGSVVSCLGDDPLGHEILDRLDRLSLDRGAVALHPTAPTGTVEVRVGRDGVPEYDIKRGVAWDHIPESPLAMDLARRADAVCFGSLAQRSEESRRTIHAFLDATPDTCLRVIDINLRQQYFSRAVVEESLERSDGLKLNDQELPVLSRLLELSSDPCRAIEALASRYDLRFVALTRGPGGSLLWADGAWHEHAGYPAKVVDTVGAGDAFTAALAIGLIFRDDVPRLHDRANRLASYVCTRPGATPDVPSEFALQNR